MNELELRIMLSGPLIALQGYVSDDLAENYARAWDLCETEEAAMQAFPVMYGQWVIPYVRGLMNEATKQGRRFLDRATAVGDKTLKMVGHRLYGSGLTWRGDPVEGARHLEIALGMFDPIIHDELAYIYSQHPRVSARAHLSFAEHALGMFGAAARTADAAVAEAIEKQHFNSIAYALCFSALLFLLRRQRDEVDARAQELLTRSEEKSASYWVLWADVMLGWVRAADGDVAGGLVAIREPLSKLEAQGANVGSPRPSSSNASFGRAGPPFGSGIGRVGGAGPDHRCGPGLLSGRVASGFRPAPGTGWRVCQRDCCRTDRRTGRDTGARRPGPRNATCHYAGRASAGQW